MSDDPRKAARRNRDLARLAQQGMALAEDLHARAKAARNADELCDLALAFDRVSRTVRDAIALEAKLARERAPKPEVAREDMAAPAAAADPARDPSDVILRKIRVKSAVERAIRQEAKGREALRLLNALDDRLEDAVLQASFTKGPAEAQAARICRDLGLAPPSPASRRSKLS